MFPLWLSEHLKVRCTRAWLGQPAADLSTLCVAVFVHGKRERDSR
jgi:hypothetical protein